jgi:hypothetical protein
MEIRRNLKRCHYKFDKEALKKTLNKPLKTNPKTTWKPPIILNSKQPPSQTLEKDLKKRPKPKPKKKPSKTHNYENIKKE